MNQYVILTDSSCDLPAALINELSIPYLPLVITLNNKQYANYLDEREISFKSFYESLRAGEQSSSSAVNTGAFIEEMEKWLSQDFDILYLGFSSGLSGTYSAGETAAEMLRAKHPNRTILTVDTLCGSLGQGLIVYLAAQEKKNGRSIREVCEFAEKIKLNICHWITVDDLQFLKRGGRISGTAATLGSILQVKPIIHVDDEGKLINVEKVRGRKASLSTLVDHMQATATEPENQVVFISHGDCEGDANLLAGMIRSRMNVKDILINYIGPVIGTHTGPGVITLFFIGRER